MSVALCDGYMLAAALTSMERPTSPGQIRVWAARGYIKRHGKDHRGRTLYDWHEVKRHFDTRHTERAA